LGVWCGLDIDVLFAGQFAFLTLSVMYIIALVHVPLVPLE
jgi:hypothetical protein